MVMDAQPSPQSVGREFVRQYYTLLNKAPTHLHRFYNHNSYFIHGGLEAACRQTNPVIGQKQIHQRIQQLNFRDCHAKISQVDSQATLGNGVVVQVSGELSNGGEPMRRFTQTFVLAAQSPKQYYVHNDIFRYQDMFGDEDIEAECSRPDDEQQVDQEQNEPGDITSGQNQNIQAGYYVGGVNAGVAVNGSTHHDEVAVPPTGPQSMPPLMQPTLYPPPIEFHLSPQPPQQQPTPPQPLQTTPVAPTPQLQQPQQPLPQPPATQQHQQPVTGVVSGADQSQINPVQNTVQVSGGQEVYQPHADQDEEEEEEEEEPEDVPVASSEDHLLHHDHEDDDEALHKQNLEDYPSLDHDDHTPHETAPTANEPPTYATRLKSGSSSGGTTTLTYLSPQAPSKSPSSPPPGARLENRNESNLGGSRGQPVSRGLSRGGPIVRGMNRGDRSSGQPRPAPLDDGNNYGDNDKRRGGGGPQQHPDNQQLFLGNLPLNATENDLRELFGKFGSILDLRIMNKPNMKGQNGKGLPNYGFIVFEDVTTVQTVLNNRPFFFPAENGIKLNVEEKKTRARSSTDGGRINSGSGGDIRPRMGPGGPSLRGGNRGFMQGRGGMFPHGRGGAPMRPGGPGSYQRNSIPR